MRVKRKCLALALALFLSPSTWALGAGVKVLEDVPSTYVYPPDGFIPWNLHRITNTILKLLMGGIAFDDPQGVACALLDVHKDVKNPANDVVVTVIGVNSGAGEILYNIGLKDVRRFGSQGSGERQFLNPVGSAVHPNGDVAVADKGNDRVALLKHDGMRLKWVAAIGKTGSAAGQFKAPSGVAFDSKGNLYIADTGNDRIQVRDARGFFKVLPTGPLQGPSALAVIDAGEAWTFHQQGPYANRLAVIDRDGTRLQTFSLSGSPLAQVTAAQVPDPPVKLYGCAFDYYGNLVATDNAKSCLRKFNKDLKFLVSFGKSGDDDYEFQEPRGIAFHHQFGQVIVAERKSAQYFWNGADAVELGTVQEAGKVRFKFFLTERALVTAEVTSRGGGTLKKLLSSQDLEEGPQELAWAPDPGQPPGDYTLKMNVMATYSSRDRIAKEISLRFPWGQ
jgi:hypothetical protein